MKIADEIALAGVVVAALGALAAWVRAGSANKTANRALELAESADKREQRQERVAFERSDVDWEATLADESGIWRLTNVGQDVAHEVKVTFSVNGDPQTVTRDTVPAAGSIDLDVREVVRALQDLHEKQRSSYAAAGQPSHARGRRSSLAIE